MASTSDEDFSFPATTTPPRSIDSPPLWQHNSAPPVFFHHERHHDYILKGKGVVMNGHEFMSLCSYQEADKRDKAVTRACYECYDQEEKMDALWEDLDEKFSRKSGKIVQTSEISASPGREVHMRCVNVSALKLSKANGHIRPNILLFIKVLKKIFVLHNSRRTIKKRAW